MLALEPKYLPAVLVGVLILRMMPNYCKDTEPYIIIYMYSLVSLLSGIYSYSAMHSLLVTIICCVT